MSLFGTIFHSFIPPLHKKWGPIYEPPNLILNSSCVQGFLMFNLTFENLTGFAVCTQMCVFSGVFASYYSRYVLQNPVLQE